MAWFLLPLQIQPCLPVESAEIVVWPFLDCCICVQTPKSRCFPHAAAMTRHCGVLVKDKRCWLVFPVMTRMISHFLVSAQNIL